VQVSELNRMDSPSFVFGRLVLDYIERDGRQHVCV